jgi:hypothetical protein
MVQGVTDIKQVGVYRCPAEIGLHTARIFQPSLYLLLRLFGRRTGNFARRAVYGIFNASKHETDSSFR